MKCYLKKTFNYFLPLCSFSTFFYGIFIAASKPKVYVMKKKLFKNPQNLKFLKNIRVAKFEVGNIFSLFNKNSKKHKNIKTEEEIFVVFDFGNLMLAVYKWVRVTLLTVAA